MARSEETSERQEKSAPPHQSTGTPGTESTQQSSDSPSQGSTRRGQPDQERAIQTNREGGQAAGQPRGTPSVRRTATASPFWLMRRFADDIDRMFEDFGLAGSGLGVRARPPRDTALERALWSPQVETFRRGDWIVVRADLPGLRKDDVKLELDDNVLTISGERSDDHEESRDGYYRSERSYGRFFRAVPLPEGVNGERCEATFKDGVLEVTVGVPKQEERKAKQIEIK